MSIGTTASWLLASLTWWRVLHLIASCNWLRKHAAQCYQPHRWPPGLSAAEIWDRYQQAGGGQLPQLAMGIKGYRMRASLERHRADRRRIRVILLLVAVALWQYQGFAPLVGLRLSFLAPASKAPPQSL